MTRTFDYELIHTTAVVLSTGSGDKYQPCASDLDDDEVYEIAARLAGHSNCCLRNGEEASIYTGWLIVDRNNDGDCFPLTDENGYCVVETTPENAQKLFLAYVRESVDNNVSVSDANLALIA